MVFSANDRLFVFSSLRQGESDEADRSLKDVKEV